MDTLLKITDLKTYFYTYEGVVKAVNGVNLEVKKGQTLGIVGESGCGKSVTALSIMRLIPDPPGKIVEGKILFEGIDLTKLSEKEMRKVRGKKISMIFQEPMTSLDPMFTIGHGIIEVLKLHQGIQKDLARQKAIDILRTVGFSDPEERIDVYPHELSGGMRQRAMIAMALACNPSLLIADEPTTALDVTIQAQILKLIDDLKEQFNTSVLLITHDLGVIAESCDNVVLMYAGYVVEKASVKTFFNNPLHPYAKGLMKSIPRLDVKRKKLDIIKGSVPNLFQIPSGCPFHPRCDYCFNKCKKTLPGLKEIKPGHCVRCWYVEEGR
jgi:peptide/nickel transport system ATP-binding protein/oligopeptide transport system ATP-binding protein